MQAVFLLVLLEKGDVKEEQDDVIRREDLFCRSDWHHVSLFIFIHHAHRQAQLCISLLNNVDVFWLHMLLQPFRHHELLLHKAT